MTKDNENLDSWDDFISGQFLKAINVESEKDAFTCTGIDVQEQDDGRINPVLKLERNGKEYDFGLNKTNAKNLKELGIATPRAVIGKKIYFKKALVRNPKTNTEVEGLRIFRID